MRPGLDKACRSIKAENRGLLGDGPETPFEDRSRQRDDPVSAHRAVTFVVEKENSQVTSPIDRLRQNTPVHVCMPPRFPYQGLSKMVQVALHVASFGQDAFSRDSGESPCDDPQGLSGCVKVESRDLRPASRWPPCSRHGFTPFRRGHDTIPPRLRSIIADPRHREARGARVLNVPARSDIQNP